MVFQFLALIVSMLIISLLILKGLHPILSVLVGCSLMCWTNGLPYASTFASGLATWGSALMPTIFVTLLGGTLGVLYTRCGGIDSLANCLMKPVKLGKSYSAQVVISILVLVMMFFAGLGGVPAIAPVFLSVFEPAGISMYVFANLVTWGVAFSGGLPTNAAITVESNLSDCTVKQTYKTIFFGSIVTATITAIVGIIFCMLGFFG